MPCLVSLLRGINVGGKNVLPMRDLRALLERLGLRNVRTYIQSGNCIFETDDTDLAGLSEQISDAVEAAFGFRSPVVTLPRESLKAAVEDNPFAGEDDEKAVHFFFLSLPAVNADVGRLDALRTATEQYALTNNVFYLHAPEGIARSKLAAQAEKHLGVSVTARNLRTVRKLSALAAG